MMRSLTYGLSVVLAALVVPVLASPPAEAPQAGSVAAEAAATDTAPVIDGSVLDDKAWATAKVITGFWQTTPDEGQPASENTEVRVIYTETALYIGVVNYDRAPELIISSESRRDASLTNTDSFLVLLDTFRDRQNGFVFGTSPAGIEYDGQVIGEGPGWRWWRRRRRRRWRWRRRRRWWWRWRWRRRWSGRRFGRRVQHQLGWFLAGRIADVRGRLERGVRNSVPHASLSGARRAGVGHQLSAKHSPPQRDLVLGAASAAVRPEPRVAGGHVVGSGDSGAAQPAVDAVPAGNEQAGWQLLGGELERKRRVRHGREVQPHAQPDARRRPTTPTSRRSRWTRSRSTSIASTCSFPRSVRSSSKTPGSSRSASAARPRCFSAGRSASAPTVSRFRSSAVRGCLDAYRRGRASASSTCRRPKRNFAAFRPTTSASRASSTSCRTVRPSARCS